MAGRNGQTQFLVWLRDEERKQWDEAAIREGFSSLAKFVRETINHHIAQSEVQQEHQVENGGIKEALAEQEERFAAKLEDVKAFLPWY